MDGLTSMRTLLGALIIAAATQSAAAATSGAIAPGDGFTRQLADLINAYRQHHGLETLAVADELASLAGEHSASMSEQRQLSHQGFRARFQRASSKVCVENVGWNYRTPEALLDGWRQSPAHHRNLLDPKVARMGIAVATRYVTFFACR